eukprot:m.17167 g.17167  ORF g.17167 m.17167 type:complete len:127 (-) comp7352_c0_seq1:36-416(-)
MPCLLCELVVNLLSMFLFATARVVFFCLCMCVNFYLFCFCWFVSLFILFFVASFCCFDLFLCSCNSHNPCCTICPCMNLDMNKGFLFQCTHHSPISCSSISYSPNFPSAEVNQEHIRAQTIVARHT